MLRTRNLIPKNTFLIDDSDTEVDSPILEPITPTKNKKRTRNDSASVLLTPPQSVPKKKLKLELSEKVTVEKEEEEESSYAPPSPCATPQRALFGRDSLYSRTKAVLQRSAGILSNNDGCLPTRQAQYEKIMDFLNTNIKSHTSNSLYLTGPPGTGKTAQVDSIQRTHLLPECPRSMKSTGSSSHLLHNQSYFQLSNGDVETVSLSSINCIALNEPSHIFTKIFESFSNDEKYPHPVTTMSDLQQFLELFPQSRTFIVVLDEMDKLVRSSTNSTHSTKTIFELFLLSKLPSINFLLIGIANSLDMTDRFLSRLNLRQDLMPETIVFQPYSSDEMYQIIMNRINLVDSTDCVFNPMAIKFAAKRCSGNTGDLRKLFDVLKSSIEVVELQVLANLKKNKASDVKIVKIGLPHVAKVFSQFMNISSTRSRINKLNMQQRILLCSLVHRQRTCLLYTSRCV